MFTRFKVTIIVVAIVTALLVLGCRPGTAMTGCEPSEGPVVVVTETERDPFAEIDAEAVLKPTEGNRANGRVGFQETNDGIKVRVQLTGLEPSSEHGFHIHEKGDCSAPDATSAGGHYAPNHNPHGLPPADNRHAGDMGNVVADDTGSVSLTETFHNFSLRGDESVVGLAVILHAKPDVGVQPTGAAGARIACGVINASTRGKSP